MPFLCDDAPCSYRHLDYYPFGFESTGAGSSSNPVFALVATAEVPARRPIHLLPPAGEEVSATFYPTCYAGGEVIVAAGRMLRTIILLCSVSTDHSACTRPTAIDFYPLPGTTVIWGLSDAMSAPDICGR